MAGTALEQQSAARRDRRATVSRLTCWCLRSAAAVDPTVMRRFGRPGTSSPARWRRAAWRRRRSRSRRRSGRPGAGRRCGRPGVRVPSRTIAPGTVVEVPGEVLAAERLPGGLRRRPGRGPRAPRRRRPPPRPWSLTTGGTPRDVLDLGRDAVRRDDGLDQVLAPGAPATAQASASSIRSVPLTVAGRRDDVLGAARRARLPHTSAAPARGSRRRDRAAGTSVTTLARA